MSVKTINIGVRIQADILMSKLERYLKIPRYHYEIGFYLYIYSLPKKELPLVN